MDPNTHRGKAGVSRNKEILEVIDMPKNNPHNYTLWVEHDGNDVWIGTSKGLAWGKGDDYYAGLRPAER